MPQFEPHTFSPQLFWLVVSFALMFLVMWRVALPRIAGILDARKRRIDQDLEKATALKEETEAVLTSYEAELERARADAHTATSKSAAEAASIAAADTAKLADKLAQEYAQAEKRIAEARAKAISSIGGVAGELAGAAVTRLTGIQAPASDIEAAVETALRERG